MNSSARLVVALSLVFLASTTTDAIAQQCGTNITGQTKIFGCLDYPPQFSTIDRDDVHLDGWALSCYTAQQPSIVELWFLGDADSTVCATDPASCATLRGQRRPMRKLTSVSGLFTVTWRLERPDVAAVMQHYCNITGARWGYSLRIDDGVIPKGWNVLSVRFFDPAIGLGVNDQQTFVFVR